MNITKDKIVAIDYTLTDHDGVVIDTSQGREPLVYMQGRGALIPGLEKELEGKTKGTKLEVAIPPEEGYGARNEELVQQAPKAHFAQVPELKVGMQFQANSPQGPIVVTIMQILDDVVVVDGNHPLAGVVLNFKVEIIDVREATAEELEHGHAHGAGGHQH